MEKTYNNLSDVELHIIREYKSWSKSNCVYALKNTMLNQWYKRAITKKISHLL